MLTPWNKGDPLTSSHLGEVVDYINSNGAVRGAKTQTGGTGTYSGGGGTIIRNLSTSLTGRWFLGSVNATGPNNETDYLNENYFLQAVFLAPTGDPTTEPEIKNETSLFALTDSNNKFISIATATNLSEQLDSSHNLAYGTIVYAFEICERLLIKTPNSDDTHIQGVYRWVFFSSSGIAPGQYQYMAYVMTSQNQAGWDYIRAHNLTP